MTSIYDKKISKQIFSLAFPTWIAFLSKDLLGIADMLFVSRLGAKSIAAVSLSGIILGIIFMMGHGISSGTVALVSQAVGRKDKEGSKLYASQSISLSFITGLVISIICIPFSDHIISAVGGKGEVITLGSSYLSIIALVAPVLLMLVSMETSIRGNNDAKTPFKSMLIANVVNIVLDPILIYGWFGFPEFGVNGSAIATMIAIIVAFCILTYSILIGKHKNNIVNSKEFIPKPLIFKKIFNIGIFSSGKMFIMNIFGLFFMRLVSSFGTVALAAFGIGLRLRIMIFGPSMGFGVASSVLTGQFIGAKRPDKAKTAIIQTTFSIIIICLIFNFLFFFFARDIISWFSSEPDILKAGITFLRWFSFSFIFLGSSLVLGRAMDGAGYTKMPMIIHAVALILIGLPLGYYLASTTLGLRGIWLSIVISNAIMTFLLVLDISRGKWINRIC